MLGPIILIAGFVVVGLRSLARMLLQVSGDALPIVADTFVTFDEVLICIGDDRPLWPQGKKERTSTEEGLAVQAVVDVEWETLQEFVDDLSFASRPTQERLERFGAMRGKSGRGCRARFTHGFHSKVDGCGIPHYASPRASRRGNRNRIPRAVCAKCRCGTAVR